MKFEDYSDYSVINLDIGQEQATLNEVSRRNFSSLKHQLLLDIQGWNFSIFSNNRKCVNELIEKRFKDYENI